ncbi:MAG TPA: sulfate adenylyltransferase, partial [Chloroflexota bacterium]|nr:sulfate adenylyltransferase [Chloroflexota bacterium]
MSSTSLKNVHNPPRTGFTIWLTGLSGAGKTTLAERLSEALGARGRAPEVLDGDVVRTHLSKGLGFSREDRDTNIRRIAFVAGLDTRQGGAVIAAAISPYRETRDEARQLISAAGEFVEVYVECPLDELVRRDVKGLYARALRGEIPNFTGVSDPYEPPLSPEVAVRTDQEGVEESVARIMAVIESRGLVDPLPASAAPAVTVTARDLDGRPHPADLAPALWRGLGQPHGGRLLPRQAPPEAVAEWDARIARGGQGAPPRLVVSAREACDLELLGNGAFSPLQGFLGPADYQRTVHEGRLSAAAGGVLWPVPIVLGSGPDPSATPAEGQDVALVAPDELGGQVLAILHLQERYPADQRAEAMQVYRTEDEAHPGVAAVYARGPLLLAGPVTVLRLPVRAPEFGPYLLRPAQTRAAFAERGWQTAVAFQTRNPVHRAHEYLLKTALEGVDGLLLHPLVGETKSDDIPADVRLRCYEALLAGYFPADRVLLSVLPAAMRYAGPREAILHALMRKNYGCTHFIVGRDHAGVGNYYGTYDAQRIFHDVSEADLGIRPLFYEHTFYCTACGAVASAKTCPHDESARLSLSGTRVRELLRAGESLPPEFTRPEVA